MLSLFLITAAFQYLSYGVTTGKEFCFDNTANLDNHYLSFAINYININSKSLFCFPHFKQIHYNTFENVAENVYEYMDDFDLDLNPNIVIPIDINNYMNINNLIMLIEYKKSRKEFRVSLLYHISVAYVTPGNQERFQEFNNEIKLYFSKKLGPDVQIYLNVHPLDHNLNYDRVSYYLNALYDTFEAKTNSAQLKLCERFGRLLSFKSKKNLGDCSPFIEMDAVLKVANFKDFCKSPMNIYGRSLFLVYDSLKDLIALTSTRGQNQDTELLDKISIGLVQVQDISRLNKLQTKLVALKKNFETAANVVDFSKCDAAVYVASLFKNLDFNNNPLNVQLNDFSMLIN